MTEKLSQFVVDYLNSGVVTDELCDRILQKPEEAVLIPNSPVSLVRTIAYYESALQYWESTTIDEVRARFDNPDGELIDAELASDLIASGIRENLNYVLIERRAREALKKLGYTFPEE